MSDLVVAGAGLLAILAGAEALVRGASSLALRAGLSRLAVGLTVVAFGTSSPELVVNLYAVRAGQSGVALGNVLGSNIANVLLILGLAAMIRPLSVATQVVRQDVPVMIASSAILLLMALDGALSRVDGALLLAFALAYLVWVFRLARAAAEPEGREASSLAMGPAVVVIGVSLVLLWAGSRWFVSGATAIAASLGVSELVIALTVVALGTSIPELATSVVASFRGERDLAVGNIVGSNIFNVLFILGASAAVAPGPVSVAPSLVAFELPIVIGVSIACAPIFFTDGQISRREGAVLVALYAAYVVFVVLQARAPELAGHFARVMVVFVAVLVATTGAALLQRARRSR